MRIVAESGSTPEQRANWHPGNAHTVAAPKN